MSLRRRPRCSASSTPSWDPWATEAEPIVSARLPRTERMPAGARVHVILPPIVSGAGYPALNVRLFEEAPITPERLLAWGALDAAMVEFLAQAVRARRSLLIAGGTGTGKTTMLNMVSDFIPRGDRVVSIEDTCELRLNVPHWVPMETRPPSIEGRYAVTALDLVNAALRMTPDWIIVGEVRAGDVAAALLQTQISGHAGLSTIHARSPWETVQTLILRCLQSGQFPKVEAIKVLITLAVDIVVQLEWDPTGLRLAGATLGFLLTASSSPALAVAGIVLGGWPPRLWLAGRARRIERAFRRELPHVAHLLAMLVASGLPVAQALERIAAQPGLAAGWLAEGLAQARGQRLLEVLLRRAQEAGIAELANLLTQLGELERTGTGVEAVLEGLATDMSTAYRAEVQRRARTIGSQMILPILVFYLLPYLVAIGAPMAASILGLFQ